MVLSVLTLKDPSGVANQMRLSVDATSANIESISNVTFQKDIHIGLANGTTLNNAGNTISSYGVLINTLNSTMNTHIVSNIASFATTNAGVATNAIAITQVTNSTATNTAGIATELTRATTAEASLQSQISNIVSNTDPSAIDSMTEIIATFTQNGASISALQTLAAANATNISALQTDLAAEIVRAISEETSNANLMTAEVSRATTAEAALQTQITNATPDSLIVDNIKIDGSHIGHITDTSLIQIAPSLVTVTGGIAVNGAPVTTSSGITNTAGEVLVSGGSVKLNDNVALNIGSGSDIVVSHDGSNSSIVSKVGNFIIDNQDTSGNTIVKLGSATNCSFDVQVVGSSIFKIDSNKVITATGSDLHVSNVSLNAAEGGDVGIKFYADEGDDDADKWKIGVADDGPLKIYRFAGGAWHSLFDLASCELSLAAGLSLTGDNKYFSIGVDSDLQLIHTGSHSKVISKTGNLIIDNENVTGATILKLGTDTTATSFQVHNKSGSSLLSLDASGVGTLTGSLAIDNVAINGTTIGHTADTDLLTLGSAQLTVAGNCDITGGADITGAALTTAAGITNTAGEVLMSGGNIQLNDDIVLSVGTGDDFKMYHQGNTSYLHNITGKIIIENDDANNDVEIRMGSTTTSTNFKVTNHLNQAIMKVSGDHSVSTYLDNASAVKDFIVHGSGAANLLKVEGATGLTTITGALAVDNVKVDGSTIGHSSDTDLLTLAANLLTVAGNCDITNGADVSGAALTTAAGITNTSGEILVSGGSLRVNDNIILSVGTGNDLKIKHDGSHNYLDSYTGDLILHNHDANSSIRCTLGSSTATSEFRIRNDDNATKFSVAGSGQVDIANNLDVSGGIDIDADVALTLGASTDITLIHNGTNSSLTSTTGNFTLDNTATNKSTIMMLGTDTTDTSFQVQNNSGTTLFKVDGSGWSKFYSSLTVDSVRIDGTNIGHTSDTDLLTLTSGQLVVAGNCDITNGADVSGAALTTAAGITNTAGSVLISGGNVHFNDNISLLLGTDSDTTIKHNDTLFTMVNSKGDMTFENTAVDKKLILKLGSATNATALNVQTNAGASKLSVDGSGQVDIANNLDVSGGIDIDADSKPLTIGASADISLVHNGSDSTLTSTTGHFKIDNTAVNKEIRMQLGSDTNATAFKVLNDTGTALLTVDGSGLTTVAGNFTVSGTTTTVNSTTVTIDDPLLHLGENNSANVVDIGFYGTYVSSGTKYTGLFWDAGDSKYRLFHGNAVAPTTTIDITDGGHAVTSLVANLEGVGASTITGSLTVDSIKIDGTTIGHTSDTDLLTLTSGQLVVAGNCDITNGADITGAALTTAVGITNTAGEILVSGGNVHLHDNIALTLGTSDDVSMKHDGTNSIVTSSGGNFTIDNIATDKKTIMLLGTDTSATSFEVHNNSASAVFSVGGGGTSTVTGVLAVDNLRLDGTTIGHSSDTDLLTLTSGQLVVAGNCDITNGADITGAALTTAVGITNSGGEILVSGGNLQLNDNIELTLGNSDDFTLKHNGSNSVIVNTTGNIIVSNTNATSGKVHIQLATATSATAFDVLNSSATTVFAVDAAGDTTVAGSLVVDNIKIDGTTIGHTADTDLLTLTAAQLAVAGNLDVTNGVDVTGAALTTAVGITNTAGEILVSGGNVQLNDSIALTLGTGNDVSMSHDGTNSIITTTTGNLTIDNTANDKATIMMLGTDTNATSFQVQNNSAAALFKVDASGVSTVAGSLVVDSVSINGATIGHTSDTDLLTVASGLLTVAGNVDATSGVDVSGAALTTSSGYTNTGGEVLISGGNLQFNDNIVLSVGTGDDLQFSHNGTHTTITSTTGNLVIDNTNNSGATNVQLGTDTNATKFQVLNNTGTSLFKVDGSSVSTIAGSLAVDNLVMNGATLGHSSDTDLLTFASAQLTVAGNCDITSGLDVSGAVITTTLGMTQTGGITDIQNGIIWFQDSKHLVFGTGEDIDVVHDGTNSKLTTKTGNFTIDNTATTKKTIMMLGTNTNATAFEVQNNSASALFAVDGSGATSFSGALTLSSSLSLPDDQWLKLGDNNDFKIRHDGSNTVAESTVGNIVLDNQATDGEVIVQLGTDTSATRFCVKNNSGGVLFQVVGDGTYTNSTAENHVREDTNNTDMRDVIELTHRTTGAPQAGIGTSIGFLTETANDNDEEGLRLGSVSTDLTNGAEDFDFVVMLMEGGGVPLERLRLTSDGHLKLVKDKSLVIGVSADLTLSHDATNSSLTSTTGNFTIDNTAADKKIIMMLGADTSATQFEVQNNSATAVLAINGAGTGTVTGSWTVDNIKIDGTTIGHTADTDLLTLTNGQLVVAGNCDITNGADITGAALTTAVGITNTAGEILISGGNLQLNDNIALTLGTGNDVSMSHDGTNSKISSGTGNITIDNTVADKKTIMLLGSNNSSTAFEVQNNSAAAKFSITGAGQADIAGNLDVTGGVDVDADGVAITVGASADVSISHDGTNSILTTTTGNFTVDNTAVDKAIQMQLGTDTNATAFKVLNNTGTALLTVDGSGLTTVGGNLTVSGTTTTVNSTTVTVDDPLLHLAENNASNTVDIGFYGKYVSGSTKYTGIVWDASDSKYRLFHGNGTAPTTVVDITDGGHLVSTLIANLEGVGASTITGSLTVDSIKIDGTTIGHTADTDLLTITNGQLVVAGNCDITNGADITGAVLTTAVGITNTAGQVLISGGNVQLNDNIALSLGTADDLILKHDGTDSIITSETSHIVVDNTNTAKNIIMRLGADNANTDFEIQNNSETVVLTIDGAGNGVVAGSWTVDSIKMNGTTIGHTADTDLLTLTNGQLVVAGNCDITNGADITGAALTTAVGITNTAGEILVSGGNVQLNDSIALTFGTGDDVSISHDGTNSKITSGTGNFTIDNTVATKKIIMMLGTDTSATTFEVQNNSASALLALDGAGTGTVAGSWTVDNIKIDGTTIGHTSDTDLLTLTSAQLVVAGNCDITNGADITGAALTTAVGITNTAGEVLVSGGNVQLNDDIVLSFGSDDDLQCKHGGTHALFTNATGNFTIDNTANDKAIIMMLGSDTSATSFSVKNNSGTALFKTQGDGASTVSGSLAIDDLIVNGTTIGHSSDTDLLTLTSAQLVVAGNCDITNGADITGAALTTAVGITNTAGEVLVSGGNVQLNDSIVLSIGTGNDVSISHDGTNSIVTTATGNFTIDNTVADKKTIMILGSDTSATGFEVQNNSAAAKLSVNGAGQVDILNNLDVSGGIDIDVDSQALTIGAGGDISISHDGTNSILTSTTGNFTIDNTANDKKTIMLLGTDTTATAFDVQNNSAASLFTVDGSGAAVFNTNQLSIEAGGRCAFGTTDVNSNLGDAQVGILNTASQTALWIKSNDSASTLIVDNSHAGSTTPVCQVLASNQSQSTDKLLQIAGTADALTVWADGKNVTGGDIDCGGSLRTVGSIVSGGMVYHESSLSSNTYLTDATGGNITWSVAQMLGGAFIRTGSGARTDATATAAAIVAALPNVHVGMSWTLVVSKDVGNLTLTGAGGVTMVGHVSASGSQLTLNGGNNYLLLFTVTNVGGGSEAIITMPIANVS